MGAALNPKQADQLVEVLAKTSPAFVAGGAVDAVDAVDWNAVPSAAQGILSPTQVALLRGVFAPDEYLNRIERLADSTKP